MSYPLFYTRLNIVFENKELFFDINDVVID